MSRWACRPWRRALEQLALGTLSGEEHSQLSAHVRGCEDCRRTYRKIIAVERLLVHGDPALIDQPTHFERERLAQRIWDGLDSRPRAARGTLARWPASLAWVASAAAVLLVGGLLLRHLGSRSTEDLTPRGGGRPAAVALRVLRLHGVQDRRQLDPPLPPPSPAGPGRLLLQDSMVLLYSNRGEVFRQPAQTGCR